MGAHISLVRRMTVVPSRLPKIYHLGWEGDSHAIVMEMLGENLEMRCEANNRHTNVQTVTPNARASTWCSLTSLTDRVDCNQMPRHAGGTAQEGVVCVCRMIPDCRRSNCGHVTLSLCQGYVHADVKPDNFLLGLTTAAPYSLYMVDLGLSMRFKTATTSRGGGGRHIGFNQNPGNAFRIAYPGILNLSILCRVFPWYSPVC